MNMVTLPQDQANEIALAEHAAVIRALGKRVVGDIVEIGRRLTEAKRIAGHGNWVPWLDGEFGWSDDTALRFMQVSGLAKTRNLRDLSLPVSGLYLLAAPSTPEEARAEVVTRAESGEHLTLADVKRIVDEARQADVAKYEKEIAHLKDVAQAREDSIRAAYADKLVLSPQEVERQVSNAIAMAQRPLQMKLDATEKKLETAKMRLEEKKAKEPEKPIAPKIDSATSLASTSIGLAIENLATKIGAISPQDMVQIEILSAKATQQTPADRLGKSINEATLIVRWLNDFISIAW